MIAILGAGISGLTLAHQLKKAGKEFVLLEAKAEAGGKIQSRQINGFLCELGPNTVLINNLETKQLIEELGLYSRLIFPNPEAVKNRFVIKNGQPEPFPSSLYTAIQTKVFGWNSLYRILKEPFVSTKKSQDEESLANFCRRRFGHQIFEDLIAPFVSGIYAGDPEKMSINHTLSILKEAEDKSGSVLRGMFQIMKAKKQQNESHQLPKQKIFSFPGGLGDLTLALTKAVEAELKLNSTIKSVEKLEDGYRLTYEKEGQTHFLNATQLISCLPPHASGKILDKLSPKLGKLLQEVPSVSALSMHYSLNKQRVGFNTPAFGLLNRKKEKLPFLGLLFNSRFFPHTSEEPERELITVIAGGSQNPELISQSETEIQSRIIPAVEEILQSRETPSLLSLKKWKNGIPQYEIGHSRFLKAIEAFRTIHPHFYFCSNYLNGVSVSDCIKNAVNLSKKI